VGAYGNVPTTLINLLRNMRIWHAYLYRKKFKFALPLTVTLLNDLRSLYRADKEKTRAESPISANKKDQSANWSRGEARVRQMAR